MFHPIENCSQTQAHQIPSTIRELKDELRMEVLLRQQQLQQRQQPTQQTQRTQQRSLDGEMDL